GCEMKRMSSQRYERAIFLMERAFELVQRTGLITEIEDRGVVLEHRAPAFSVFCSDPRKVIGGEFHHLDIRTPCPVVKVFSVRWIDREAPEIVTFKRGAWEEYFLH